MRVAILGYDGCLASGVSGFADVLATANLLSGKDIFSVRLLSADGAPIRPFSGPPLPADGAVEAPGEACVWDIVYVPPAFGLETPDAGLADWVSRAHAAGAAACGACAGVFFLAEAGILRGRVATTHWGLAARFAARYPDVRLEPERILADGGDYVCAGGVTACYDLALRLTARCGSPELAASCARLLLLDPGRASQTPYRSLIGAASHGDEAVLRVQELIEGRCERSWRLGELAEAARLSERTLLRRFKKALGRTPGEHAQAVRVERAKRLLESSAQAIGAIAAAVGCRDVPAFYRLFKTLTGLTPGAYRERFGMYGRRGAGLTSG